MYLLLRALVSLLVAVVAFLAVTALGVGVYYLIDGVVGLGLLIYVVPVTLLVAALVGSLTARIGLDTDGGSRSSSP